MARVATQLIHFASGCDGVMQLLRLKDRMRRPNTTSPMHMLSDTSMFTMQKGMEKGSIGKMHDGHEGSEEHRTKQRGSRSWYDDMEH